MRRAGAEAALGRFAQRWILAAARAPRAALAVLAVLVAAAIAAASGTRVDTDTSGMLASDLPFQERAQEIAAAFPAVKNTVVVVARSHHRDAAEAAVARIAARLEPQEDRIGRIFASTYDPFFRRNGLLYLDPDELETQLSQLSQASNLIAALRTDPTTEGFFRALDHMATLAAQAEIDPTALSPFFDAAARTLRTEAEGEPIPFDWSGTFEADRGPDEGPYVRTLTVEPVFDFDRLSPARPAIEAVDNAVAALDPDVSALVQVGVTGEPVLRAEELRSVSAGIGLSLGLSLALVAVMLALFLGGAGRVALALACVLVTVVLTAGAARLTGPLNLISVAFVVLMVGLGIDFAIHLLAHLDERVAGGATPAAALAASGPEVGGALALSAATTALAFFAFVGTDFVGMAQLGMIGGIGVLIALAAAYTLIPAAVALRPALARGPRAVRSEDRRLFSHLRPGRGTAIAAAVVGAAALFIAPQARFDADPMNLRDPAAPSVVTHGWLAEAPERSPLRMSLIVDSPEAAEAAAERLKALPEVAGAVWLDDLVPKEQARKLEQIDLAWPSIQNAVEGEPVELSAAGAEDGRARRVAELGTPEARTLAEEMEAWRSRRTPARERVLDEALFRFFPPLIERLEAQLQAGPVQVEDLPPELVSRYRTPDGRLRVEILPEQDITRDAAARAAFVEAVQNVAPEAGGPPAQIVGASGTVSSAMLQAVAVACAGAAALAWLTLRRARPVGAIMLPLLLAGTVTLAASALLDLPFNYANIVVLPLMVGVGIDAGVHLTMRSLSAGGEVFETSTPRATLASALTTIAAFGTLALSQHPGTASMGLMLTIAMIASVTMVFALTPALVRR